MSFNDIDRKRIEKTVDAFVQRHRPPMHIRSKLDLGFRFQGQSVEIFEIRPVWRFPDEKVEYPVAKAVFVKSRKTWKVYWQRADLKWHAYAPVPEVGSVEEFLGLVGEDDHACFFG